MGYWTDARNNPKNEQGMRMLNVSRSHVWCWDARPYPAFPARQDIWSDGPAWERGHWLNGRAGAVKLAAVVADLCRMAGVSHFDVSGLSGVVRGFLVNGGESGRAALQPLMLAYGFDAVERDGTLCFLTRSGLPVAELGHDELATTDELDGIETVRAPDAAMAGRVRLTFAEAGGDYSAATSESVLPGDHQEAVSETEFPLVLTRSEGRAIVERWLNEARVSRDTARFALPPSRADIRVGDVVRLRPRDAESRCWRIDRVESAGALTVDAVRVEDGVYRPALAVDDRHPVRKYLPPVPVWPLFMDLPLLTGDEEPHQPFLAVTAQPWPGTVAAYMSVDEEGGFNLNTTLDRKAIMGQTLDPLPVARAGVFDRGPALRIRFKGARLQSATERALLAGANTVAIGDGTLENWEILQFARAVPVNAEVWEISQRLRGQAGTDGIVPQVWPAGSLVVLLDGAPKQVKLAARARGQERFWRIGPATRSPDDPSYKAQRTVVRGIGLRPYAPCHLQVQGNTVSWIRRTRIEGDSWDGVDVPLGETRERYLLRIEQNGRTLHEAQVSTSQYTVPAVVWASAQAFGPFTIEVAQLSDQFGAGPFARRTIHV